MENMEIDLDNIQIKITKQLNGLTAIEYKKPITTLSIDLYNNTMHFHIKTQKTNIDFDKVELTNTDLIKVKDLIQNMTNKYDFQELLKIYFKYIDHEKIAHTFIFYTWP